MRTPRLLVATTAAAALVLSLAACGGGSDDTAGTAAEGSDAPAADAFPVTVKHAYGETVIEKKPERIAAVAWANASSPRHCWRPVGDRVPVEGIVSRAATRAEATRR